MITVQANPRDVAEAQRYFAHIQNGWRKATVRALNKTARTGRTAIAKEIRNTYTVKYGGLLGAMKIKNANYGGLTAYINISGQPLGIGQFKHSMTKKQGAKAQILKAGSLKPITTPSGIKSFWMNGDAVQRRGKPRGPLDTKFGPSIPVMAGGKRVWPKVEPKIDMALSRYLNAQIDQLIAGGGGF